MDLTPENKKTIDGKTYRQLFAGWRFAPLGDPWFQGETGKYWGGRIDQLEAEGADRVATSKSIGWR